MCVFCRSNIEGIDHLLFRYGFSKRIWREVLIRCLVHNPYTDREEIMIRGLIALKGRNLKAALCRLSWSATVYNIWRQRNDIKHGNQLIDQKRKLCRISFGRLELGLWQKGDSKRRP
jgi:hypothetical protein